MVCRLCKKDEPLRDSHIFSEWLYKPLYNENHRFFVLSTDTNKRRRTRPKGIYEKLLCGDCEGRLSVWERIAHDVFYSTPLELIEDHRKFVFSGVPYAPFKLFGMSLLWRASITRRPEVPRIDLGPHAERIRMMLEDERPGEPHEYGSILMLPSLDQGLMQQFMYPPERLPTQLDGHTAYRAVFGGLFWLFIVSNHSTRLPQAVFLSKEGRLPVFKITEPALGFMQRLATGFSEAGMLDESKSLARRQLTKRCT